MNKGTEAGEKWHVPNLGAREGPGGHRSELDRELGLCPVGEPLGLQQSHRRGECPGPGGQLPAATDRKALTQGWGQEGD